MKTLRDLFGKLKQSHEGAARCSITRPCSSAAISATAASIQSRIYPCSSPVAVLKHGQHLAFDENNHPPLCNVFVYMLQRLGIESDKFANSTGTLNGLEMV